MTLVEALALINTVTLAPMSAFVHTGYDCSDGALYGASRDGSVVVVVDGNNLELEILEGGNVTVYTLTMNEGA